MNIIQFKKDLAEFLLTHKIDNYHGKVYIHCVNGTATTIEMRRTERVKDLVGE